MDVQRISYPSIRMFFNQHDVAGKPLRNAQCRYASSALDWTDLSATLLNEAQPLPLEAIARPTVSPAASGILKRSFSARPPLAGRFSFSGILPDD